MAVTTAGPTTLEKAMAVQSKEPVWRSTKQTPPPLQKNKKKRSTQQIKKNQQKRGFAHLAPLARINDIWSCKGINKDMVMPWLFPPFPYSVNALLIILLGVPRGGGSKYSTPRTDHDLVSDNEMLCRICTHRICTHREQIQPRKHVVGHADRIAFTG